MMAILVFYFVPISEVFAASWNLEKGKSQFIITNSFYQTEEFFDKTSNKKKQPEFTKFESDYLYEYGYNDYITIGFHPRLQRISQETSGKKLVDSGLSSLDAFARIGLIKKSNLLYKDDGFVFSLQPLLKLSPPNAKNKDFSVTSDQWDFEMRTLTGYSFKYFDNYHFVNAEMGYRLRDGEPSNEVFFDGTLGVRFRGTYMFLGQIFYTTSIQEDSNKSVSIANPLDYELTKVQFSVVKEINKKYSLQLGVFKNIDGENTGVGNGGLLSLWINF